MTKTIESVDVHSNARMSDKATPNRTMRMSRDGFAGPSRRRDHAPGAAADGGWSAGSRGAGAAVAQASIAGWQTESRPRDFAATIDLEGFR